MSGLVVFGETFIGVGIVVMGIVSVIAMVVAAGSGGGVAQVAPEAEQDVKIG